MNIKDLFGIYNLRVRLHTGLLFLTPLLIQLYLFIPEVRTLNNTLFIVIITFILTGVIIMFLRNRVKNTIKKCYPHLLPAQNFLLPSNDAIDPITKKRYYYFLEHNVTGFEVKTEGVDMYDSTESAIKWLISRTRDPHKFPLVFEENMNFGLSYNLLALRPYAIGFLATNFIVLTINTIATSIRLEYVTLPFNNILALTFIFLFLLIWIFLVNQKSVISNGENYARALLSTLDSSQL